jgi:hypothetical protein
MTALEVRSSSKAKRATPPTSKASKSEPNPKQPKSSATAAGQVKVEVPAENTKQDRILSLLKRRNGATILEMMQATGWQQHSVRGFLAGTVKKKLGLDLTSSKSDGELRRYRIVPHRGR